MAEKRELINKIHKAERELKDLVDKQEGKGNISAKQGNKAWANVDKSTTKAWVKADKAATKDWVKADKAATKAWVNVDKATTKSWVEADQKEKASGGPINKNYAYGGRVAKMSAEKS